jgi:hypothetical protein
MAMPPSSHSPPRWPLAALRAALPRDAVGDAIVGDLHEEFVHDAAHLGASRARTLYWQRAASVVARATFDELRLRSWASDAPTVEAPRAAAVPNVSRVRMGAGLGVGALAFAVLGVGIVANTVLFAAVRGTPRQALPSAVGIGATALALLSAGVAAVVLCAGPRWLRRRALRRRRGA